MEYSIRLDGIKVGSRITLRKGNRHGTITGRDFWARTWSVKVCGEAGILDVSERQIAYLGWKAR